MYPVTVLFITPSKPSVTVTAEVTSLPQPDHNAVWFDIDLAAFPSGGTLSISGATGAYGCAVSSYLADQCARYPASGDAVLLDNVSNVQPGEFWAFPVYHFAAGTNVLHFGTEGNWAGSPGTVNINTVTITVQ